MSTKLAFLTIRARENPSYKFITLAYLLREDFLEGCFWELNIYLHYILDLWFERMARKELRGFADLIRYADDFIVCFQGPSEAKAFGDKLKQRLGPFGLRIAENKSRIIEFGRYVW